MAEIFGGLQIYRERPIPASSEISGKENYRATPIDAAGAANAEPLVSAGEFGLAGRNYYAHSRNPPYYAPIPGAIDTLHVRRGVAERLRAVNARLNGADLELFLYDAWRPQAVQIHFHDHWLPRRLLAMRPALTPAELTAEVEKYWAAPSAGDGAPSPHATGGAVDLTVRWRDGETLWMGSLFDDASAIAHTAHFETKPDSLAFSFSDEEARANRRLLYWLMTEAGFASNPSEWWHFSFGDQMWAKITGAPAALYASAPPPPRP